MRAILTYHSIDDSRSPISIDAAAFRRHVEWLASGHVQVVPIAELVALPVDADAVAITFDDGFQNFGSIAAPLLLDAGLPSTVFVVTGNVGGTNAWSGVADATVPTLPLLDWDALGRLAEQGVSLGAHTRSHPKLTRLSSAQVCEEIDASIEQVRTRTGVTPETFAYPYGDVNADVAALARPRVRWSCTTELAPLSAYNDVALLPRLDMFYWRDAGMLESWGTPRFRRKIWVRARARRVRAALTAVRGA